MAEVSLVKLPLDACHLMLLMVSQHWFSNSSVPSGNRPLHGYIKQCGPNFSTHYGVTWSQCFKYKARLTLVMCSLHASSQLSLYDISSWCTFYSNSMQEYWISYTSDDMVSCSSYTYHVQMTQLALFIVNLNLAEMWRTSLFKHHIPALGS